jgi:hypothetical protein
MRVDCQLLALVDNIYGAVDDETLWPIFLGSAWRCPGVGIPDGRRRFPLTSSLPRTTLGAIISWSLFSQHSP